MTDKITKCSLEELVQKGTVKCVSKKLETTPVILDDENYHDYSLIITALSNRNVKVAKFLIERGFRVYKKSKLHAEKTPLHYAVEVAEFQLIRLMLIKGAGPDVTAIDDSGKSPLHIAIIREEAIVLEDLLLSTKTQTLDDMLLLHYSVENHNIQLLKLLLKKGLLPIKKNMHNETPFCIAVKKDYLDVLCLLWESYKDIIESNPDFNNLVGLLFVSIIVDNIDNLTEILDTGLSIDITLQPHNDGWSLFEHFAGFSMLHCAVKYIQLEIVHFLLGTGIDMNILDVTESSALHIAFENKARSETNSECYKINEKIIDLLFNAIEGNYVDFINDYGISHFHLACTRNRQKLVMHFLENGASVNDSVDLNSPIYKGFSPLHFAVKYKCKNIVELLLKVGADIEQEAHFKMTPLHIAARESSIQVAKILIKHGADISKQDSDGNTPVHYAFEAKNYEILDFLLSVHAIINANPVNSQGLSHFHIACSRTDISIIAGFLRNGASVNTCVPIDPNIQYVNHNDDTDWHGCSPLHFAAAFNRAEVAQFLLDQNACVEVSDARGLTPFHIACQYTCEKFDELIKDNLSSKNICEMDRNCKLYEDRFIDVAAMENQFKACHPYEYSKMLEDGEDTGLIDWSSNRKNHVNIFQLLINHNCDVNKVDGFGNGPLFYICYFNLKKILSTMNDTMDCTALVQMQLLKSFLKEMFYRRHILLNCLLKQNVNMEKCYKNGSILHYVSVNREYSDMGRMELMKIFLNLGANVNATDEKMQTPLHLATQMKDKDIVAILLEYNADVNCVQSENLATPLHIATSSFCQESIQIIYLLLMSEPDVNLKQLNGRTPLHNLLSRRHDYDSEFKPIFDRFVILGVDLDVQDNKGKTPLFMACTIVNCEVVENLLECGADVTLEDCNGLNIYQFVYGQIKKFLVAYQKLNSDLIEVFWLLLKHAIKLAVLKLLSLEKILQIWYDLKELIKPIQIQNQDLNKLVTKCEGETVILANTKIHNNISMYELLFQEDYQMIKYINNVVLQAILESHSFDEIYKCYGYLLKLKFNRGVARSQLLPSAKQCLSYLTKTRLPDYYFDDILRHLNNYEIRGFIRAVSVIKNERKTSIVLAPLKIVENSSKYSRLA